MKAAVISLGSKTSMMILEEMKKHFESVDYLNLREIEVTLTSDKFEVLYGGKPLLDYDCIYLMGSFRYNSVLASVAAALKDKVYIPSSHNAYLIANDKYLTQLHFQRSNIPMPEAYIVATSSAAKKVLGKVHYPIIIKVPQGTHGKGVLYAESYASASSMCDALLIMRQPFIIQSYIETGGVDIRAIVAGGQVVAAMKRHALNDEKRSNTHAGGIGQPCTLDMKTHAVAVQAAKSLGSDVCAIDLLESAKGPVVLEANLSPGIQGITQATGTNVAAKIAKALFERTKVFKKSKSKDGYNEILKEINGKEEKLPSREVVTSLKFRGERILLPQIATFVSNFKPDQNCRIKVKKGRIIIQKEEEL